MPCAAYRSARYVSRKNPRPSLWTSGSITTTPGIAVETTRTSGLVLEHAEEVLAVRARAHARRKAPHVGCRDVAHAVRNLFEARDHQTLALLDRMNVVRGLHERVVRAGVEPRDAARELLDVQLAALEIRAVHVSDLELAACGRLQAR